MTQEQGHPESAHHAQRAEGAVSQQRWLTIQEVADALRISRDTVERWIHAGQLRAVDISAKAAAPSGRSTWRVSVSSLDQLLEDRANKPGIRPRPKRRQRQTDVIEFIK